MYRVEKMINGERVTMGLYRDIELATAAIDLDMRIHGADIVYYVERVESYVTEQSYS